MPDERKYDWRKIDRVEEYKRPTWIRLSDFRQVNCPYDEWTAQEQASRCVQCPNANCVAACPMELPIPELLGLMADGKFAAAAELMFSTESLPEFFGHMCVEGRLCEAVCVLGKTSEPVPIRGLSRFLLDYGWKHGLAEAPSAPRNSQRVSVVGSGLCALVAADGLSRHGYPVTIIDSANKPGGRLMNGLPGFRLDRTIMEYRIELLRRRGVVFRMGVNWGGSISLRELRRESDSVFIGLGRTNPVPLQIPGDGLDGVHQAHAFVVEKTADSPLVAPPINVEGLRVLVLGAGETAMHAARVALRCGAREVTCVSRRDQANLAANPENYREAVEEGAKFQFLSQATEVLANEHGQVRGLRCTRTALKGKDADGRGVPRLVSGTGFEITGDIVLVAFGFTPPTLPQGADFEVLAVDQRGCVIVDDHHATNLEGVFAAGSIVRGPLSLPEVVMDARSAAEHLHSYLTAGHGEKAA